MTEQEEREIKFRAKAINRDPDCEYRTNYKNGDWVYGLLTRPSFTSSYGTLPAEMTNTHGISGIEVDDNTLGQYIGVKDKNGQEVYEDDIVKTKFGRLCKVVWFSSDSNKCFDLQPINMFYDENKAPDRYDLWKSENIEVVGNIYDNKDLLK